MTFKLLFNTAILEVSDLAHQGPALYCVILPSWKCRPFHFCFLWTLSDAKAMLPLHQKHLEAPGVASLFKRAGEQGGI